METESDEVSENTPLVAPISQMEKIEPPLLESDELLLPTDTERGHRPMKRGVTPLQLMMFAFFTTAGGPFGIETAIQAGGPLLTMIGLLVLPFLWSLPQALMSAELSLLINENGGNVVWVQRAFGDFIGWINAYNNIGCTFASFGSGLALLVAYLPYEFNWWEGFLIKFGFIILVTILNLIGLRLISRLSMVLTIVVFAPFVAVIVAVFLRHENDWDSIFAVPPEHYFQWGLFFSTLVWSYGGYDNVGSLAGEVKTARGFLLGIVGSFPMLVMNYIIPLYFAYLIHPVYQDWKKGYFTNIAYMVGKWAGIWMVTTVIVGGFAGQTTALAYLSRVIWAMARNEGKTQYLPSILSWSWQRHTGTVRPIAAVIFTGVTCTLLSLVPFEILIQIFLILRVINLACEYGALIKFRYSQPTAERPFRIPGHNIWVWLMPLPAAALALFTVIEAPYSVWITGGAFNVFVLITYPIMRLVQKRRAAKRAENLIQ